MILERFHAFLTIDGVEAREYACESSSDGKTASCWVASETGKSFSVRWTDTSDSRVYTTSGYVNIDGIDCGGKLILPGNELGSVHKSEFLTSQRTCRPFLFSRLELTDDDSFLVSTSAESLGEIRLDIWLVSIGCIVELSGNHPPEAAKLHERSKKAIVDCVRFGEEKAYKAQPTFRTAKQAQLATFTFKYRPIDLLRANGIAAPELVMARLHPPPEIFANQALKSEEDPDLAELRNLEEKIKRVKAKVREKGIRVKAETSTNSAFQPPEIIDLTID